MPDQERTARVIELMRQLLIVRDDQYSIEMSKSWVVARDRQNHDLPLTDETLEQHFFSDRCVGAYMLRPDSTVKFLAFDVDVQKTGRFYPIRDGQPYAEFDLGNPGIANLEAVMWDEDHPAYRWIWLVLNITVLEIATQCKKILGLRSMVVITGGGAHVLVPFGDNEVLAADARAMGDEVVAATNIFEQKSAAFWTLAGYVKKEHPVEVEVFPKQDQIREDGYGNLIRLPLGKHRRTGRRSFFAAPGTDTSRPWAMPKADAVKVLERCASQFAG